MAQNIFLSQYCVQKCQVCNGPKNEVIDISILKNDYLTSYFTQASFATVNFINIIHRRAFFVRFFWQSQKITRKITFVRKIRTYNVDEIDTWGRFHQRFGERFSRAFFVRTSFSSYVLVMYKKLARKMRAKTLVKSSVHI